MFLRAKKRGPHTYLMVVQNERVNGRVRQKVLQSLGRLDQLQESGALDRLLLSAQRFSERLSVLDAAGRGEAALEPPVHLGAPLVFGRLWRDLGLDRVLTRLLRGRRFGFAVERAVFLTVLHRLVVSGSDRAAERWRDEYAIPGAETLELHHLYRAMAWLGEELPASEQAHATPFAPRCTKDLIEEDLFFSRRNLFSALDLVFFDTTSIYFEGEGGDTLGQYGHSKDDRPDLKQMVVGALLDGEGHPVATELWPGHTTDVKTLVPVADRLRHRFGVGSVCLVADRGMIAKDTVKEIEQTPGLAYILGARLRQTKEVNETVLGRAGRYEEVYPKSVDPKAPAPLKVKEVWVEDRRYIVCLNEDQAKKDAADRAAIVAHLTEQLKQGAKSLVGNRGYRKYLQAEEGKPFTLDEGKIKAEARLDGKWVLRTNLLLPAREIALKYKQLWMVEDAFRTMKSVLETRPVYHRCDETIRGHVFCSFLALVLRAELEERLAARGGTREWAEVLRDLERVVECRLTLSGKGYVLRSETPGCAGKVLQACGVALPPRVREG